MKCNILEILNEKVLKFSHDSHEYVEVSMMIQVGGEITKRNTLFDIKEWSKMKRRGYIIE